MQKLFVLYTGDDEGRYIYNISELKNAKIHSYHSIRVDAFRTAKHLKDVSYVILRQGFLLQSGKLFLVEVGHGNNIIDISETDLSVTVED